MLSSLCVHPNASVKVTPGKIICGSVDSIILNCDFNSKYYHYLQMATDVLILMYICHIFPVNINKYKFQHKFVGN